MKNVGKFMIVIGIMCCLVSIVAGMIQVELFSNYESFVAEDISNLMFVATKWLVIGGCFVNYIVGKAKVEG